MRAARAALGLALAAASLAAACNGTNGKGSDIPGHTPSPSPSPSPSLAPAPSPEPDAPPKKIAARPFFTLTDALDRSIYGRGFEPGVETIWSPVHDGIHASLYYLATRGAGSLHYHKAHEETLFVVDGEGSLLLPGGKPVHLEPGIMVRLQPGVCHGWSGDRRNPLKAVVLVTPPYTKDEKDLVEANADAPGTLAAPWVMDVTSTDALEALPPPPEKGSPSILKRKRLDASKFSTVTVAALRDAKIPDHIHEHHDETAIIFAKKGYGFVHADEVVHIVDAGSIMHLPEGTVHGVEHAAEGHMRAVTIHTPAYDETDHKLIAPTPETERPVVTPEGTPFRAPAPLKPQVIVGPDGAQAPGTPGGR